MCTLEGGEARRESTAKDGLFGWRDCCRDFGVDTLSYMPELPPGMSNEDASAKMEALLEKVAMEENARMPAVVLPAAATSRQAEARDGAPRLAQRIT